MIAWIALIDWLSIPVNVSCITCVGGEKVRERNGGSSVRLFRKTVIVSTGPLIAIWVVYVTHACYSDLVDSRLL